MTQLSFTKCVFAALLFAAACTTDDVEKNPSFNVGSGGKHSTQDAGPDAAPPPSTSSGGKVVDASMGSGGTGGLDASSSAGGNPADAGSSGGMPSTGGAPADAEPPYDCVLHPKTHLEIINACTDAVRIEKHPMLPPVPMH
jgi:hypothetical protein